MCPAEISVSWISLELDHSPVTVFWTKTCKKMIGSIFGTVFKNSLLRWEEVFFLLLFPPVASQEHKHKGWSSSGHLESSGDL